MSNEEKKEKKEEAKKKSIERLKRYVETGETEIPKEEPLFILGIPVFSEQCYKIMVGRFIYVGKVASRTKSIIVIEDAVGKRAGIMVSKINMISEYDCKDLEDLRKQLEKRRKK